MKHYGIDNPEGSDITNLTAPSGTSDPANPNAGELFFRTDSGKLRIHDGTSWADISTGAGGGVFSEVDTRNFVAGSGAGAALTAGASDNFIAGLNAGAAISSGDGNVVIGPTAGNNLSTGGNNIVIGKEAGRYPTSTRENVFLGYRAGRSSAGLPLSSSGIRNIAIGQRSLYNIQTAGGYNIALGSGAGFSITTGDHNIMLGASAGSARSTGNGNICIGRSSSSGATGGAYNVLIGRAAGNVGSGGYNVCIGNYAGPTSGTHNNELYINDERSNTPLIHGDFANDELTINGNFTAIGVAGTLAVAGGNMSITGGAAVDGDGGDVTIAGGTTSADGRGGNIILTPGYSSGDNNGDIRIVPHASAVVETPDLRFYELTGNGNSYTGFRAPASLTSSLDELIYTLPSDTPADGEVLTWNTGGTLSWETAGGAFTLDGNNNLFAGTSAGAALTTGSENFLAGTNVGDAIDVGGGNVAIGEGSLGSLVNGNRNVTIGEFAGSLLTSSGNVILGGRAGRYFTTGQSNTIIGDQTGQNLDGASTDNVFLGSNAGRSSGGLSVNSNNTFIGTASGTSIQGAFSNVGIGKSALNFLTTGSNNIAIGASAGLKITTGIDNIIIGDVAGPTTNQSGQLFINNGETDTPLIHGTFNASPASRDVTIHGILKVSSTFDYETTISDDDDVPNKKYVDDAVGGNVTVDNFADGVDYTSGTTTALTLSVTPPSENAIIVTFDGVTQHHDTYTVAGAVVTFDAAIPLGTNDVEVRTLTSANINTPADGTVTYAKLASEIQNIVSGKNFIINGNFNIWQRGTSFATPAGDDYNADRFQIGGVLGSNVTVKQSTDVPTFAESGLKSNYSLQVDVTTADTNITAAEVLALQYRMEGYDYAQLAEQNATLSFWVKSPKTGTHCVSFRSNFGARSYVAEYTVNVADTWEKKSVTVALTGDEGGTLWDYTNGTGLIIGWALAIGSNFQTTANTWQTGNYLATSNQVNCLDNVANNFHIAQVQFESGSIATPYERKALEQELRHCKRYYWKELNVSIAARANNTSVVWGATRNHPIEMRAAPTMTFTNTGTIGGTPGSILLDLISVKRFRAYISGGTFTIGEAIIIYGDLTADAEL